MTAARQQVTSEWWEDSRRRFDTFISVLVLQEAQEGDDHAAEKRLEAVSEMPVLEMAEAAEALAGELVRNGTIPKEHVEDALHIALATVNGMDFLLTWNFQHINNATIKSKITRTVEEQGYECPVICSPEELAEG